MFGEVALLNNSYRTATVISLNYCTCATLPKEDFFEMCKIFPESLNKLKRSMRAYQDPWKRFIKTMLLNVEYLSALCDTTIEELLSSLRDDFYEQGSRVFQSGDTCYGLMLICEGELDIIVKMEDGEELVLDTLYQGCNVGAFSMLADTPYVFYGVARTHLKVKFLFKLTVYELRKILVDLDDELAVFERYIESKGPPMCDFKFMFSKNYIPQAREKF